MSIEVQSPFSGRPVKIRPQDVGKAVRDEEGRIFYVLPKRDGSGYYGAPTRAGGQRDEQRAARYEQRMAEARQVNQARSEAQVHHERKKARANRWVRLLVFFGAAMGIVTRLRP
jgi:hypothetical protein